MSWYNRKYGLSIKTDQKFVKMMTSGWLTIEYKTENQQKKIIIMPNQKRGVAISAVALLFFMYIFLNMIIVILFIVVLFVFILLRIGSSPTKTCITENRLDNSIIIKKQSSLGGEITVYKKKKIQY